VNHHLDDRDVYLEQGSSPWPVVMVVGGVLGCLGLASLMMCSLAGLFYLGASAPEPVYWEYDHGSEWTEPIPVTGSTDPRLADLRDARGGWVADQGVDFYGTQPAVFSHYFLVFEGSYGYVSPGAIVVGDRWDNSESPMWRVVYGHTRDDGRWYIGSYGLTHLGDTWDPTWAEKADILYEEIGQKDLPLKVEGP